MANAMAPILIPSLKAACQSRLQELILNGEYPIGARLPSERDLAVKLQVSRPVVHQAIVSLAAGGLVRIEPRRGVFVNDFSRDASLAMLNTLIDYQDGILDAELQESLISMRKLLECETARLCARYRTEADLQELARILTQEQQLSSQEIERMIALDFELHLQIALASQNVVYPMIINSFKGIYTHLTGRFFERYAGKPQVTQVFDTHIALVQAINEQDSEQAATIMVEMLDQGAANLMQEGD